MVRIRANSMNYLTFKAERLKEEWRSGIADLAGSLRELSDHYTRASEIEYCTHIHTSDCQDKVDCPCSYDHECENGIIKQENKLWKKN